MSTDSGETWVQQTLSGLRLWNCITSSSDGKKLAAGVNGGYIYTSLIVTSTNFKSINNDLSYIIAYKEAGSASVAITQYQINGCDLNVVLGKRVNSTPTGFQINGVDLINIFI